LRLGFNDSIAASQAEGHVVRGWKTTASLKAFPFKDKTNVVACPPVVYYMGKGAQHGNPGFANAEQDPFNPSRSTSDPRNRQRRVLGHCARAYALAALRAFYTCGKSGEAGQCSFETALKPVLDHAFAWADAKFATLRAGGATEPFVGPDAKKRDSGFAKDMASSYKDPTGHVVADIYVPNAAETPTAPLWDSLAANPAAADAGVCTQLEARYGMTQKYSHAFTNYANPTPKTTGGPDNDVRVRSTPNVAIGATTSST